MSEVSQKKYQQLLERKFFHDIANSITCLKFGTEFLENETDFSKNKNTILELQEEINLLNEKIIRQKMLISAANHELTIHPTTTNVHTIIKSLINQLQNIATSKNITLQAHYAENINLTIDQNILLQVLENIVKNAIQASPNGNEVKINYTINDDKINFHIHNNGHIHKDIQKQIFLNSISNNKPIIGIGTYAIQLLSEKYLQGTVKFSCTNNETIFIASYPLNINT